MKALGAVLLWGALAVVAEAQPTECPADPVCAFVTGDLDGPAVLAPLPDGMAPSRCPDPLDTSLFRRALAAPDAQPFAAEADVVAVVHGRGEVRRVVVLNRASVSQFLALPDAGEGVPSPLHPVAVSSGDLAEVPALVAVVDDEAGRLVYGLRIPARTTVVFAPVRPEDVRPRGLDE